MSIGFVLEKVRHGSPLSTGELKMLGDEIDRLADRLAACAAEVSRRDETDAVSRQQDKARAERLRLAEEDVARLRPALEHEKQRRETNVERLENAVKQLEGILRDIHYGLLYQPELTREELASTIATEVTPHPNPYRR